MLWAGLSVQTVCLKHVTCTRQTPEPRVPHIEALTANKACSYCGNGWHSNGRQHNCPSYSATKK